MHEDELTTINYEEDNDPILPDGWSDGDDFFADPKTWSGAAEQSGQTAETQSELESIAAEMETTEVPTTDETEATDGQSAVSETEDQTSGQTEEPVKNTRILKLKVNHQDQEVDINSMTDDELIAALQKSRAFDAMKDEQAKARYREIYNEQIAEGMTPAAAKMIATNECNGKTYPLEDAAEPEVPETPAPAPAHSAPSRDFDKEVQQLLAIYPEVSSIPDEVALATANGTDLLTAYVAYRERQTSKAAASLKRENEVLKQNAASAAKAPVRGTTGGGATDTKPKNNLLVGFDSDDW